VGYLDDLFSLRDRTALVTGATSGIGQAIAEALARAGAAVVLVGRDESRLDAATSALVSESLAATARHADLSRREEVDRLCAGLDDDGLVPDILVNSAGVNLRPPMADLTNADVAETMAVNLTAPFLLGQFAGPRMAARGWGRIINIASQQAVSAFGNSGIYGVTKAGVTGLTRSQAEAWSGFGVCCNTVVPGFVATRMTQQVLAQPGRSEALAARTMVGRNGVPEDFCGAAVFLASEASAYVTGQLIFVDGGFSVT
jgi:NAD(P)-dependent dehydrogenase (short-subunit alcohol dehydrogenase family)